MRTGGFRPGAAVPRGGSKPSGARGESSMINQRNLSEVPLIIAPVAEQVRLASTLRSVLPRIDAPVERLVRAKTCLKQFRLAVLATACSRKLTEDWRREHPDTEQVELPETWAWASLEELKGLAPNTITDGPFGSNLKTEHYTDSGPRVIRLQNIGRGIFIDEPGA
jgi:hypothetical protein